jgi:hypothetical protein
MTHAEIAFAFIVGAISAIGLIWGSILTSRASDRAARSARQAMEHQTKLNAKGKIAEFRQAWINNLRDAMAKFMAVGSDRKHGTETDMVEAGIKMQLLMNRNGARIPELVEYMGDFSLAMADDHHYDAQKFVMLCQEILKGEWEVLKKELLELS